MTLGASRIPYKETLNSSVRDMASCPRRGFMLRVGSGASSASPALLRVPSSSRSLLGIELTNASFEGESSGTIHINLFMQLTDSCGRPYGPALPLAVLCAGASADARLCASMCVPLTTGQRVALFVAHDGPATSTFSLTIAGRALFQLHESKEKCQGVMKSLMNMIKNDGVTVTDTHTRSEAASRRSLSKDVLADCSVPSRKRSRSTAVDDEIPSLVPAFVQGADDDS